MQVSNNDLSVQSITGFSLEQQNECIEQGYTTAELEERVKQGFTATQILNAIKIKLIHDKVEIAAYNGLQKAVDEMNLQCTKGTTTITEDQSRKILHIYVKAAAHKVMRGEGGYMKERGKFLDSKQLAPIIANVPLIVRDRDSKLTHASYTSFEALVGALDEHNAMVNGILFNAWGVPHREGVSHLAEIKKLAGYIGPKEVTAAP